MPKTTDPLIRIAKELANLSIEDAARAVNISKELRFLAPQQVAALPQGTKTTSPAKKRGRKPGSKNKKKELDMDKTFPKVEHTDSGVGQ